MIGFYDGFWFTMGVFAASFFLTLLLAIVGFIAKQLGVVN